MPSGVCFPVNHFFFFQTSGSEDPADERKPLLQEEVRENKACACQGSANP